MISSKRSRNTGSNNGGGMGGAGSGSGRISGSRSGGRSVSMSGSRGGSRSGNRSVSRSGGVIRRVRIDLRWTWAVSIVMSGVHERFAECDPSPVAVDDVRNKL